VNDDYEIGKVTGKTLDVIIDFLAPHEYKCVSLMKRLLQEKTDPSPKKNQSIFFIKKRNDFLQKQAVQGVFLLTKGGLLLHYFVSFDFQALLKPVLHKKKLYCVAGTAEGSALLESALRKAPKTIYDYHLMAYGYLHSLESNVEKRIKTPAQNALRDGFSLRHCSLLDAKALYPLQKAYQIQEVLPPGESFSEKNCRIVLQNMLLEQTVCAIIDERNGSVVAKAGTNAQGLNWVQIGGVYTSPEYRSSGFARYLVRYLAEKSSKSTVLFVKKDNLPAIVSYRNADFSVVGEYRICYI